MAQNAVMAQQALRVLGSPFRDLAECLSALLTPEVVEREVVFGGLAGMYDPLRGEVKESVVRCRRAGIRVVMITGDYPHSPPRVGSASSASLRSTSPKMRPTARPAPGADQRRLGFPGKSSAAPCTPVVF